MYIGEFVKKWRNDTERLEIERTLGNFGKIQIRMLSVMDSYTKEMWGSKKKKKKINQEEWVENN